MPKTSAGLLMYKLKDSKIYVFIVHPGGPFWKDKDIGAWSIPKGEADNNEKTEGELLSLAMNVFGSLCKSNVLLCMALR